jgi:hypothetical protein
MERIYKELVMIAKDGVIDDKEKNQLGSIMQTIDEVQAVINEIQTLLKISQSKANQQ